MRRQWQPTPVAAACWLGLTIFIGCSVTSTPPSVSAPGDAADAPVGSDVSMSAANDASANPGVDGDVGGGGSADAASPGTDATPVPPTGKRLTIAAGAFARDHSIVSFSLPDRAGQSLLLMGDGGVTLPLQVASDGTATFVLPALAAGQTATFSITTAAAPLPVGVDLVQEANGVRFVSGASNMLRFQTQGVLPAGAAAMYLRGGYIYPYYTPAGGIPTDDYPPSHPHQHGIWTAWLSAQFGGRTINFWDFTGGVRGKVDFESLDGTWKGPVHSGLSAKLAHIDLSAAQPVTALNEQWIITAYKTHDGPPPYFVFDLSSRQEAATAMPVVINQATYSGFGMRGARPWVTGPVTYLNSEGMNRATGDGTASRWAYLGGTVGGNMVGAAMLGHPQNFRAPQRVRFNPMEPYWAFAPMRTGSFTIDAATPLVNHFRIVTLDGPPDVALIDRLWKDFAMPATVTVQ